MDVLRALDHAWFVRIHETWRAPFLDVVMALASRKWPWVPMVVAVLAYSSWRLGRPALRLAVLSVALLVVSDLAANTIKGEVRRLRPGRTLESDAPAAMGRKASFSFPSAAATNVSAAAVLWSTWHPGLAVPLAAVTAVVGYSRVYRGEHYPSDVAAGTLLGAALGGVVALVDARRRRRQPGAIALGSPDRD